MISPVTLLLKQIFGNEFGYAKLLDNGVELADGHYSGLAISGQSITINGLSLEYGKGIGAGRPITEDGKLIAGYLAYKMGLNNGLNDVSARVFAIESTNYGNSAGLTKHKKDSFKKRLDDKKTTLLVKKKTVITNGKEVALLLNSGFKYSFDNEHFDIRCTGWVWKPGQQSAYIIVEDIST